MVEALSIPFPFEWTEALKNRVFPSSFPSSCTHFMTPPDKLNFLPLFLGKAPGPAKFPLRLRLNQSSVLGESALEQAASSKFDNHRTLSIRAQGDVFRTPHLQFFLVL